MDATQPNLPLTESRAAFARRLGVHRSQITRWAQAGRIVLTSGGNVCVAESLARIDATEGGRPDLKALHAAARGAPVTPPDSAPPAAGYRDTARPDVQLPPATGPDTEGRTRYKAIQVHLENQSIKLDMALRRGQRHFLPAIKKESAGLGGTLRAALERFIDQTAPRLSVLDPDGRAALLAEQQRALRRLIRAEFPRALRKVRQAAGG